jgi:hypothetical protein
LRLFRKSFWGKEAGRGNGIVFMILIDKSILSFSITLVLAFNERNSSDIFSLLMGGAGFPPLEEICSEHREPKGAQLQILPLYETISSVSHRIPRFLLFRLLFSFIFR